MDAWKTPFFCHDCKWYYDSREDLQEHLRRYENHKTCHVCRRNFRSVQALNQHAWDEKHGWRCQACDLILWSAKSLQGHRKDEHECTNCDTLFPNAERLEQHLVSCQSSSNNPRHSQPVHSQSSSHIQCIGCDAEFTKYSQMFRHIEKDYCCSDVDWMRLAVALLEYDEHWRYAYFEVRGDFLEDKRDGYDAVADLELFFCPNEECGRGPFRDFFSLIEHIESRACDFSVDDELMIGLFAHLRQELSIFKRESR